MTPTTNYPRQTNTMEGKKTIVISVNFFYGLDGKVVFKNIGTSAPLDSKAKDYLRKTVVKIELLIEKLNKHL